MVVERTDKEILIRLPLNVNISEIQDVLDFLKYQENTANFGVSRAEFDELSENVNKAIWKELKEQRNLFNF